MCTVIQVY